MRRTFKRIPFFRCFVLHVRLLFSCHFFQIEWLDYKTKKNAAKKIKSMTNDIGIFEKFMLNKNINVSPNEPKLSDGFLADNRANLTKILLYTNPSKEERNNFIKSYVRYNYESQRISKFRSMEFIKRFVKKLYDNKNQ